MSITSLIVTLCLCAVPLVYLSASFKRAPSERCGSARFGFALAAVVSAIAASLLLWIDNSTNSLGWLSGSLVSMVLLLLITFIGLVITRFSHRYLAGEAGEQRYYQYLYLTLACVSTAVISNHLLVLWAAWVGISLGLHRLLMFYPNRPRAALAAHKKFLLARLAELCLLAAAVLLYSQHGTWQIDQIIAAYPDKTLTPAEHLAAVLLALTAIVKCAQLPVHGWLIQVVEAPTPVSALLHAGIINLGGFLLISFAPLLSQAVFAQWLLMIVAGLTVLLAGLIVLTRVSVKVRLAWSTSAQMGLMLVECALGLYELALLHLVAHSCYKAHAFLNAGSTVEYSLYRRLAPAQFVRLSQWLCAFGMAIATVAVPLLLLAPVPAYSPWLLVVAMLTLLFAQRTHSAKPLLWLSSLGLAALLVVAYYGQKTALGVMLADTLAPTNMLMDIWFSVLVVLLFAGYLTLTYATHTRFAKRLWHALYAGLYLDEWSTRITLAVWPTRLPNTLNAKQLPQALLKQESLL